LQIFSQDIFHKNLQNFEGFYENKVCSKRILSHISIKTIPHNFSALFSKKAHPLVQIYTQKKLTKKVIIEIKQIEINGFNFKSHKVNHAAIASILVAKAKTSKTLFVRIFISSSVFSLKLS
jgi:hypothetical protein